ncbi:MAG: hypothetical protein ACJ8KU_02605 [Chthoniobacterales bacterium]
MAADLYRLVLAGKRVRWAAEPLLQAVLILLIVVFVWVDQWQQRDIKSIVYWRVLLQVLKLLALYIAAAVCLPDLENRGQRIDTYTYYDQTRRLSFGALIAGLVLFSVYGWSGEHPFRWRWDMLRALTYIGPYAVMMFIRWRWLNILLLSAVLIYFGSSIMEYRLTG